MLVLINTVSIAIARTLAGAASLLSRLQHSAAQTRADPDQFELLLRIWGPALTPSPAPA